MFKRDEWARNEMSRLAKYEIKLAQLAEELGISRTYLCAIMDGDNLRDGSRGGDGARGGCSRKKVHETISRMIEEKKKGG